MKDYNNEQSPNYAKELFVSILKVNFSLLGPIGIILDETLFNYGDRLKTERLEKFVSAMDLEIKDIKNNQFQLNNLRENSDFYDLTREVFRTVLKTNSELKLATLANFYTRQFITQDIINHDKNLFITKIIDELTETHLSILHFLNTKVEEYKKLNNYERVYNDYCENNNVINIEKSLFRAFLKDIENKTLCRFSLNVHEYGSTGGYVESEDSRIVPGLNITKLGKELITYIMTSKYYG